MEQAKLKLSNYIMQVILQVTEWKINVDKDLLAANIFKFKVKFCHAYISNLLTEDNYNATTILYINARSYEVVKLIVEEELLLNNIPLAYFLERCYSYVIRMYHTTILKENIDKYQNNLAILEEN